MLKRIVAIVAALAMPALVLAQSDRGRWPSEH